MPPVQPYVSNTPLTVAANLRYVDANGDLVTRLYPNDYVELIGSHTSILISSMAAANTLLGTYGNNITTLQSQVAALQSSGDTFMLYVTGTCLYSNDGLPHQIDDAVNRLMGNTCQYNTILGTPTELANTVGAQCTNLATLPAYSQNSDMAGLAGWFTTPVTIAQVVSNDLKAYCDIRTGMDNVMAAVTPTCSQVIVDYSPISNTPLTFQLYFRGYTFIPTGYSDNSSTIKITDDYGNIYLTGFNIVTASEDTNPVTLQTSGSALSYSSPSYEILVTSKVTNSTLGTTCEKAVIRRVPNPTATITPSECCPDMGTWSLVVTSGSTISASYNLISGLSYTPRYVGITSKSAANVGMSSAGVLDMYQIYITYVFGGAVLNFASGGGHADFAGTLEYDWIAYR